MRCWMLSVPTVLIFFHSPPEELIIVRIPLCVSHLSRDSFVSQPLRWDHLFRFGIGMRKFEGTTAASDTIFANTCWTQLSSH